MGGYSCLKSSTMISWVRILRSNKQVVELFCLIVSLPLVFLNIEFHLSDMYPRHTSVAAAVNYRKVRQSTFENFNQTVEVPNDQINLNEIKDDEFERAYKTM